MFKLLANLFEIVNALIGILSRKQIGDTAIEKAKESSDAQEIKDMRNDKDFADRLTPAITNELCEKLNNRP